MVAILFLQSGIDKVINWSGEKGFYESHFKNTFLKNTVGLLMPIITLSELLAGFVTLGGLVMFLLNGDTEVAKWGMLLASISIIQLFFGQRVAKDFAGAATLVPYFFLTVVGLYLFLV